MPTSKSRTAAELAELDDDELVQLSEVAAVLGVDKTAVARWARQGDFIRPAKMTLSPVRPLRTWRLGDVRRYKAELESLIAV